MKNPVKLTKAILIKVTHVIRANINELECRGPDRCPDRGYPNFKRYIGLAVGARRIGQELIATQRQLLQPIDRKQKAVA